MPNRIIGGQTLNDLVASSFAADAADQAKYERDLQFRQLGARDQAQLALQRQQYAQQQQQDLFKNALAVAAMDEQKRQYGKLSAQQEAIRNQNALAAVLGLYGQSIGQGRYTSDQLLNFRDILAADEKAVKDLNDQVGATAAAAIKKQGVFETNPTYQARLAEARKAEAKRIAPSNQRYPLDPNTGFFSAPPMIGTQGQQPGQPNFGFLGPLLKQFGYDIDLSGIPGLGGGGVGFVPSVPVPPVDLGPGPNFNPDFGYQNLPPVSENVPGIAPSPAAQANELPTPIPEQGGAFSTVLRYIFPFLQQPAPPPPRGTRFRPADVERPNKPKNGLVP